MAENLPAPLVPVDCDCTDLDGFMLNVERLMASELVALSTHEVIGAALFLWCRAWKQRPASSLPDDERVLAAYARLPLPRFRKLRDETMRGFVKCSDGRFYHRVLAVEALKAYEKKLAFQNKRNGDAERLRKWRKSRSETQPETNIETGSETRFVAEGQGQGQGQGQGRDKEEKNTPPAAASPVAVTAAAEDDLEPPDFLKRAQAPMAEREVVDQAFALWTPMANDIGISDVGYLNSDRRAALAQRLAEIGGIEGWKLFLEKVRSAAFLRKPDGHPKFWVGLGKLLEPEHFSKIMEDRYAEQHRRGDDNPDERSTGAAIAGLREELAR